MHKSIIRARSANRNVKIQIRTYENYLHEDMSFSTSKDVEFLSAVSLGLKHRVKKIIRTGRHNLQIRDRSGSNAVHIAAKKNDPELLKMICEKGVPASIRKRDGMFLTPFMIASKHGCKESLEYLHMEARVDIFTRDNEGQNAVHYAAIGGSLECFVYLVKNAKLPYKDCNTVNGNTVLHLAAKHGNLAVIKYCCEVLKLDPHQFNYQGMAPLRFAIENNYLHTVTYFVGVWSVNVFLPDDKGISPIAYAASYKHLFIIFSYLSDMVPAESLVEGDLLLTRSIHEPPLTPLKAAFKYNNSQAIELISKKTEKQRKINVHWISTHSNILGKLDKSIINNIINYT
ncbi:hypothetical protein SteCoe_10897 [Stentor coeruleus]|uniref:Uncharacterized protein n=1 Tax=Stentor coeruleus TaxID=5963 RepID=A0A1R2CEL7_9CILI|nr:hypothetical protein SteCoe_10897 [Stentor coeruleus]